MKPVPLLLLLSSVLLSSHPRPAACRPPGLLRAQRLQDALLEAAVGDAAASDLMGDHVLPFLQRTDPDRLHLLPGEEEALLPGEEEALRSAEQLKRSEEPPLSIDLTFHLLRNMIQMAKMESQRERAQLNRKVLDEVGK